MGKIKIRRFLSELVRENTLIDIKAFSVNYFLIVFTE